MQTSTNLNIFNTNHILQLISKPIAIINNEGIVKSYNRCFSVYFRIHEEFNEEFHISELIPECSNILEQLGGAKLLDLKEEKFSVALQLNGSDEYQLNYTLKPIDENRKELFLFEVIDMDEVIKQENSRKLFLFDRLMEELPLNIYFKDLKSRFIIVSNPMLHYCGLKNMNEIIGKTDFDIFDTEHAQQAYNDEQEIIKTRTAKSQEEKEVWEDGRVTYVATTKHPLIDARKKVIGTFGISQDITELKLFEKQLKEAHDKLSEKSSSLEKTLNELKETQSRLIQSEKMQALGQLISGIAHEINTPLGAIGASAENIQESLGNMINTFINELNKYSQTDLNIFKQLISSSKENTTHLISKEKRQRKKMLICQLQENNCPNAIQIAELLVYMNLKSVPLEWMQNKNLLSICSAARNFSSLIKNSANIRLATDKSSKIVYALKSYAHKSLHGEKATINLAENIETVLILNRNRIKHGINVVKHYEQTSLVKVYQDELGQVWNNLINNAIQAMDGEGTLTIEIKNINKQWVAVTIADEGCGIPSEHQPHIFEPFYTTKNTGEGTGLGLDIVKKIVDKHSGKITFNTEIDKGTSFEVTLPLN